MVIVDGTALYKPLMPDQSKPCHYQFVGMSLVIAVACQNLNIGLKIILIYLYSFMFL